jgi:hypothetical protein
MTCPPPNPAPGLTRGLCHRPEAPDQVRGGVSGPISRALRTGGRA